MSLEEKIDEILKGDKEDRVLSVAADVLRALVILHGSAWQSDLADTLTGLWSVKGIDLNSMITREDLVPKALEHLNKLGLVRSEKRHRADLSRQEPVKDELYTVKDLATLIRIFATDSLIARYRKEIMGYEALRL